MFTKVFTKNLTLNIQFISQTINFLQHSQITFCKEERLHAMGTNICKNITEINIRIQEPKHGQIFSYLIRTIYFSFQFKTVQHNATQNVRKFATYHLCHHLESENDQNITPHCMSYWG